MTSLARERVVSEEVRVDADVSSVWRAWTTEAGIEEWFAPDCRIDCSPMGAYEVYFDPEAEAGRRGGEGNVVLAVQSERFLSFTWNAPPSFPEVRDQRTSVVVRFEPADEDRTRVRLVHSGWPGRGEWDDAFEYFGSAWGEVVLPRLQYRFAAGPVDWEDRAAVEQWTESR